MNSQSIPLGLQTSSIIMRIIGTSYGVKELFYASNNNVTRHTFTNEK